MPKLTLNLEALDVESFETARANDAGRGTVRAHDASRRADSCGCPIYTDGCSFVGCLQTTTETTGTTGTTVDTGDTTSPPVSNNCWTIIEN